ncbi:membrane protein insertase YidC [Hyphomonas sp. WL0036]|uniref:membrane protein insertase YidC n=1 Tax=Hyphomonas sediminis TaxID=2866160 RepID=UPI001C8126C5|nr:membrane protein insertase YidC [Hyphomonas sediminis]MBY9065608.1 membrane protein insertase YidC [Hyphomonas sediminis]
MEKEEQRNFLIAIAAMIAFVFLYQFFIMEPAQKRYQAEQAAKTAAEQTGVADTGATEILGPKPLEDALKEGDRVAFDGASMDGSIRLAGARIDDLSLKNYYTTVDNVAEIRLLRPEATEGGYFGTYYWADGNSLVAGRNSAWTQVSGNTLKTGAPITLRYEAEGMTIDREILVDENFMFTFRDTLTNTSDAARNVRAIGSIERHGDWKRFLEITDPASATSGGPAHLGLMGVVEGDLRLQKYKPLFQSKKISGESKEGTFLSDEGGWWGLTDMYWMGALVPEQARPFTASVNRASLARGGPLELRTEGEAIVVAPGASVTVENRLFAGAKRFEVLQGYEKSGLPRFVDAIDWGWAYFLTKPFFYILHWLNSHIGSFGWSILAFTVLVKVPLAPLYNGSYKSMAKLKKLQEPMKAINERFAGDPQRRQQEIMKLYKEEGANPIGGCVPILFTIPIFYALYKTLYVSLEMRHAPFWFMKDLSAPDPTAIGNLFGLIPFWSAADIKTIPVIGMIIGIGILPLLYGATMGAIQSLSPPPPDKMQARIIMAMPIVFMFVFGGFAAGLVLYWVWSNILTFVQQYTIMRLNGAETEIGKFIAKRLGKNKAQAE